jgi:hypothetical protein
MKRLFKYDYLIVGLLAFVYYLLLFSKIRSFVFFSGDAGDWLAASIWWMVPQPYGSPLFITLGHLINSIPLFTLPVRMTIFMDVIPASITVATMYLICKKLTNIRIALVCSLVLLGSAVYLTQATILDEFAISSMFISLAFYFYLNDKKKLTVLMLALGSAIQIIVVAISGIWFILHLNEVKKWWKTYWIYVTFGLLPYGLILFLMYLPTPRLLSGSLSWAGIDNYLGATGTVASMSLFEAPERLLQFCSIFIASLGFAMAPIFVSFKGLTKYGKPMLVAVVTVLFILWLYVTDSDPGTWHFLPIAYPLIMIFVSLGLFKMAQVHQKVVACGAVVLILVNGVFLNANILAHQNPLATDYEQDLWSLPDGSFVVSNSGGNYGLANYYVMALGKDIRPIFIDGDIPDLKMFSEEKQVEYENFLVNYLVMNYKLKQDIAQTQVDAMVVKRLETHLSPRYQGYLGWMSDKYGLQGTNAVEQVVWLLSQGKDVYIAIPTVTPYWQDIFQVETGHNTLSKITGVNVD